MVRVPVDPWGHAYVYSTKGKGFELVCYGADGKEGGDGVNADLEVSG